MENPIDIVFIGGILFLMAYVVRSHMKKYSHLKNLDQLASIPLEIPPDEFRRRFMTQLRYNKHYFQGEMFSDTEFYIQYIPPMTPDKGWIALRGVMLDGEIRYDVVGKPIYRSEEFERNRLIGKLQELCSATGAPATREDA